MGNTMSLHLFTKSWINDYPWLKLAMTSVIKLCKEDIHWTVVGDRGSKQDIEKVVVQAMQGGGKEVSVKMIEAQELWPEADAIGNGYLNQQWIKMNSHMAMGDGLFFNWDSDVIATKPFSSQNFIGKSGKPVYWISQFNSIMNGADRPAHEGRIALMKEVFGLNALPKEYMTGEVPFEYMRCMPSPLYGGLLRACSSKVEWARSFNMLKTGDHRFSEFNVIGRAFHTLFPEAFEWRNAEADGPTHSGGYVEGGVGSGQFQAHAIVAQGWSWGGVPPHIQKFVDEL